MLSTVTGIRRLTRNFICPVCGGNPTLAPGHAIRCAGFLTDDYAHCTRENFGGSLSPDNSQPPTYAHLIDGNKCRCGVPHAWPGAGAGLSAHGPAAPRPSPPVTRAPQVSRVVVKATPWKICDAEGKVLAVHTRLDYNVGPKSYSWNQVNGKSGLNGCSPGQLIYGLETLNPNPATPVILVEGERAADALRSVAGPMVTVLGTTCGAPKAPDAIAFLPLKGRRIFLWPDNDEVGLEQMRITASRLVGIVADIRLIHWAEREKDDAADFVERGGTATQFRQLALAAPQVEDIAPEDDGTVCWADVKVETVSFLWYPYLPRGKVTLLEGMPSVGKSFLCCSIAACISQGYGLPSMDHQEPGLVLFMSAEDGIADTLKPRIEKMKPPPNMNMIRSIAEPFTFDQAGLALLDKAIARYQPALVIFDPIFSFFGGKVNVNQANETRVIMTALYERAMKAKCAILGLRHLRKSATGDPMSAGLGSIDIAAASRSILLAGCDPQDDMNRGVVHTKSNLAANGRTLGYRLDPRDGFDWLGCSSLTADKILSHHGDKGSMEGQAAIRWLRLYLGQHGICDSIDVIAAASAQGITKSMAFTAASAIPVQYIGRDMRWALPAVERVETAIEQARREREQA